MWCGMDGMDVGIMVTDGSLSLAIQAAQNTLTNISGVPIASLSPDQIADASMTFIQLAALLDVLAQECDRVLRPQEEAHVDYSKQRPGDDPPVD